MEITRPLKAVVAEPETVRELWDIGVEADTDSPSKFSADIATETARSHYIVSKRHIVLE